MKYGAMERELDRRSKERILEDKKNEKKMIRCGTCHNGEMKVLYDISSK